MVAKPDPISVIKLLRIILSYFNYNNNHAFPGALSCIPDLLLFLLLPHMSSLSTFLPCFDMPLFPKGGAQRLCMLSDLYLGCFRSISGCVLAKVMFFLLFKCYTMERKGESHTERDREERLGRESLIICVTSGADTGISMATRRNKNDREGG